MSLHHPWLLLLLLLLPLVWWRWSRQRRGRGMTFSSTSVLEAAGRSWAVRMAWLPPALRSLALIVLVVCLARPQKADEHTRVFTEGVAIQLVVDRSGSMLAQDFTIDRRPVSRLAAVRKVVEDFVTGGESLPGRPDDLVGLISFATFADSVCPLTFDHDHLVETVRATEVAEDEEDRATAIGDAVALGVERIRGLERRADLTGTDRIKSRIMIVLTDGESNAGDIDPLTAAEMAASFDIKVYTIGAGTRNSTAPMPMIDPFTGRRVVRPVPVSIDEETLQRMAEITGGDYFRATDSSSLENIYARIDELERTEIEQRRYTDYQELSVRSVSIGRVTVPPLLAVVLVLLAADILLANTRFLRIP